MIHRVKISDRAQKQLEKVPKNIRQKLMGWVGMVKTQGLEKVRKVPGFHDEPLKGRRFGQRSIRLNLFYRATYVIKGFEIEFVEIQEVTKHVY